jgi:hypothetical protein
MRFDYILIHIQYGTNNNEMKEKEEHIHIKYPRIDRQTDVIENMSLRFSFEQKKKFSLFLDN